MKALEVNKAMEKNPHVMAFNEKAGDAQAEAGKQMAGLGQSVKRGDLADLGLDIGKGRAGRGGEADGWAWAEREAGRPRGFGLGYREGTRRPRRGSRWLGLGRA